MGESSGTAVGGSSSVVRPVASPRLVLVPSPHLFLTSARTRCASCCMNSQASPALVPGNHSCTTWMASTARGKSGATPSTCSLEVGRREYGGRGLWERWREAMFLSCQWAREERWESEGRG